MTRERENYHAVRYRGKDGDWWWTLTDKRNNEVVGSSHQGFDDARDCEHNFFINTGWESFDEVKT